MPSCPPVSYWILAHVSPAHVRPAASSTTGAINPLGVAPVVTPFVAFYCVANLDVGNVMELERLVAHKRACFARHVHEFFDGFGFFWTNSQRCLLAGSMTVSPTLNRSKEVVIGVSAVPMFCASESPR